MPTHHLFLDDSGTKEYADSPDGYDRGRSRYFVFGGLLLSNEEAAILAGEIIALKNRTFGTTKVEIKSNWLRRPDEREKHYLRPFGVTEASLTAFVNDYYTAIENTELDLLASVVDKVHMQAAYPNPWYAPAVAYEILLQRAVQAVRAPDSFSVTIDDMSGATPHGNQYKYNLTRQHGMLQRFGSRLQRGLSFVPLEGRLRFTDSAAHHLIQVADVVAYNVFRQFRDHGEAWEDDTKELPVYDYFDRIASKFRKGDGGRIQGYGIVKFPLVKRVAWIAPPKK